MNKAENGSTSWKATHDQVAAELASIATGGGVAATAVERKISFLDATTRHRGDLMTTVGGLIPFVGRPVYNQHTWYRNTNYEDDEPLDPVPEGLADTVPAVSGQMTGTMQCQRTTVDGSSAQPLTVLVSVKAQCGQVPADCEVAEPRVAVDIIVVMDVSGSMMNGDKLRQLRLTLLAAIDLLGPRTASPSSSSTTPPRASRRSRA